MKHSDLAPSPGSRKKKKRIGRGGSRGTTSGRGQKGQKSRSGGVKPPGFEGGQTPWYRRLPKYRGFKNFNRKEYHIINLRDLKVFQEGEEVNPGSLLEKKLIDDLKKPVKLLGDGEIEKPLNFKLHKFSKKAKQAIIDAGGKAEVIT
ncbi:MAG: 50S ribosomal protein L15 [Candidatus Eremiobacteraeota bacterium]|nr:50S ribosomal protein L15 [Candidatus Eremiobacteraeota bacterium]